MFQIILNYPHRRYHRPYHRCRYHRHHQHRCHHSSRSVSAKNNISTSSESDPANHQTNVAGTNLAAEGEQEGPFHLRLCLW